MRDKVTKIFVVKNVFECVSKYKSLVALLKEFGWENTVVRNQLLLLC